MEDKSWNIQNSIWELRLNITKKYWDYDEQANYRAIVCIGDEQDLRNFFIDILIRQIEAQLSTVFVDKHIPLKRVMHYFE